MAPQKTVIQLVSNFSSRVIVNIAFSINVSSLIAMKFGGNVYHPQKMNLHDLKCWVWSGACLRPKLLVIEKYLNIQLIDWKRVFLKLCTMSSLEILLLFSALLQKLMWFHEAWLKILTHVDSDPGKMCPSQFNDSFWIFKVTLYKIIIFGSYTYLFLQYKNFFIRNPQSVGMLSACQTVFFSKL